MKTMIDGQKLQFLLLPLEVASKYECNYSLIRLNIFIKS